MLRHTFIIFIILLIGYQSFAQGWQKTYPDMGCGTSECPSNIWDIQVAHDGGYIALERIFHHNSTMTTHFSVLKTDVDGNLQWRKLYPSLGLKNDAVRIRPTLDTGYVISGREYDNYFTDLETFILKIDAQGDTLWKHYFKGIAYDNEVEVTPSGNYILNTHSFWDTIGYNTTGFLYEISPQGNLIWSKQYTDTIHFDIEILDDSSIFSVSTVKQNSSSVGLMITKMDANGNILWTKNYPQFGIGTLSPFIQHGFRLTALPDSGFVVINDVSQNFNTIIRFKPNGDIQWQDIIPVLGNGDFNGISTTADSQIMVVGYNRKPAFGSSFPDTLIGVVHKVDAETGTLLWSKDIPNSYVTNSQLNAIVLDNQGYNVLGGELNGSSTIWKMDPNGVVFGNLIEGQVYYDINNNCLLDSAEIPMQQWVVEIKKSDALYYALTDNNGFYSIDVDTGNYTITVFPNSPIWGFCQNNQLGQILIPFDTIIVDFAVQALALCPLLEVEVSNLFVRQCCVNTYTIDYCNKGTQDAPNAYIEIEIDDDLIVTGSSIPWNSQSENTYTFPVGTVNWGDCGQFTIQFVPDTFNVVLGETFCTEAHIFPDSLCVPANNWSGAEVSVTGECLNNSIRFKLENIGTADMSQSKNYFVIEDHVIMMTVPYQLNQGDSLIINLPQTGKTYTVIAEQEDNHPFSEAPMAAVELCPFASNGALGIINDFYADDAAPFIDVSCTTLIGSYDPNDKQATPEGWGNQHFIAQNTPIHYKIRFQNTGTDTAFNIIIRDTIDTDELNISSIDFGASSHSYQVELLGHNIVKFTFDNIMLPDSNINEPASHGFVEFNIHQKLDNPIGNLIENSAAIYFDFNPPIITNTVFHTVGQLPFVVKTDNTLSSPETTALTVYPNPFLQKATFELHDKTPRNLDFTVFDAMGRIVHQEHFNQTYQFEFHRKGLTSGLYFFTITENGKLLSKGKIITK